MFECLSLTTQVSDGRTSNLYRLKPVPDLWADANRVSVGKRPCVENASLFRNAEIANSAAGKRNGIVPVCRIRLRLVNTTWIILTVIQKIDSTAQLDCMGPKFRASILRPSESMTCVLIGARSETGRVAEGLRGNYMAVMPRFFRSNFHSGCLQFFCAASSLHCEHQQADTSAPPTITRQVEKTVSQMFAWGCHPLQNTTQLPF